MYTCSHMHATHTHTHNTHTIYSKAGANMIVAGSAVYKAKDPKHVITTMRESVKKFGNGE